MTDSVQEFHPEQAPPRNADAEASVLGACLIDNTAFRKVSEFIQSSTVFYWQANRYIFEAMQSLACSEKPIDLITLREELERRGHLESVGGNETLICLLEVLPTAANCQHYAKIVRDKFYLRECIRVGYQLVEAAYEPGAEPLDVFNLGVGELQRVRFSDNRGAAEHIGNLLQDKVRSYSEGRLSYRNNFHTGFPMLDKVWQKMRPGYLLTISARTSEGKSTLMNQTSRGVAREGPVLIWTGECPRDVLVDRLLSMESLVTSDELTYCKPEEIGRLWPRLHGGISRLENLPIWIMDESIPGTLRNIEATVHWVQEQEQRPIVQLVLDRLELMEYEGRYESENVKYKRLIEDIKRMAMRLKVLTVLVQQPNQDRKRDSARDKPTLGDLAFGTATQQCSQAVVFLNNPEYDIDRSRPGMVEAHVLKCQDGPVGVVPLYWRPELPAFFNSESEYFRLAGN